MRTYVAQQILTHSQSLRQKAHGTHHIQEMKIIMARAAAAVAFYRSAAEYNIKTAVNRIDAIDCRQEVKVVELAEGTDLQQYVGNSRGRFYSRDNVSADQLGIHHQFKDNQDRQTKDKTRGQFRTTKNLTVLRSTAAPAVDSWSIKDESGQGIPFQTSGGGMQFFVPKRSLNQHIVRRPAPARQLSH